MKRDVTSGRYYAGLDLPFLATHSMVAEKLRELGLTDIRVYPRVRSLPGDIKHDYSGSWTTWVVATYDGAPRNIDLGRYVRWLVKSVN